MFPTDVTTASATMHCVELADGPLFFRHGGSGPPLLLLHGWGGSSRYWQPTIDALASIRSMYAPDLPGFGISPPLTDTATGERLARLVVEFADALDLDHFDLNGHSFASSIAVYVAAGWPERVNRLVLTCASTYRDARERWFVQQLHYVWSLWMALRRPWMARRRWFYRLAARRFYYRVPPDDGLHCANVADFLCMDKRTAVESATSAAHVAYHARLREVRAPTLVIGARQDQIMPTSGTPVVDRLIPDSRLAWIERCGHLPMFERPDRYHSLLHSFLGD